MSISAANNQPARICIVEDDPVMKSMVSDYLEKHNMRVFSASGRREMLEHLVASEPDLVILDLRLGQEDGFDLLREIKSRSNVPVIITTGDRRDEIDRVVGLELGADDYVTKPFSLRELLARIRAVLRRQAAGRAAPERGRCKFGGWQLDRRSAQHGKPRRAIRDDQPDAREGQAGRAGVAERLVVPQKPGNAGGGKGPKR